MVEGGVGEGDLGRGRFDQLDPVAEPPPGDREHLGALVEPGDAVAACEQLLRDEARSRRDVEHGPAVARDARHHRPAPARVLTERQRGADAVVVRAERGEEGAGVRAALGHRLYPAMLLYPGAVTLLADLERIAAGARAQAPEGGVVGAVLAAEATPGLRAYLCAFEAPDGSRSWIVLDDAGAPVTARKDVRDAVAIAALCEIAEESAAGGDLDELLAQLVALRVTENPEGIDEAEDALRALQRTIGTPPQLASPRRLDEIGAATRRLEQALDPAAPSPFTAALKGAQGTIDELLREVEQTYRAPLSL